MKPYTFTLVSVTMTSFQGQSTVKMYQVVFSGCGCGRTERFALRVLWSTGWSGGGDDQGGWNTKSRPPHSALRHAREGARRCHGDVPQHQDASAGAAKEHVPVSRQPWHRGHPLPTNQGETWNWDVFVPPPPLHTHIYSYTHTLPCPHKKVWWGGGGLMESLCLFFLFSFCLCCCSGGGGVFVCVCVPTHVFCVVFVCVCVCVCCVLCVCVCFGWGVGASSRDDNSCCGFATDPILCPPPSVENYQSFRPSRWGGARAHRMW